MSELNEQVRRATVATSDALASAAMITLSLPAGDREQGALLVSAVEHLGRALDALNALAHALHAQALAKGPRDA